MIGDWRPTKNDLLVPLQEEFLMAGIDRVAIEAEIKYLRDQLELAGVKLQHATRRESVFKGRMLRIQSL